MSQADQDIAVRLSLAEKTTSITVSEHTSRLDTATESHQDALTLGPQELANLPLRDGNVLSALSFFANPSGGQSPTIVVDGMERTDSVTRNTGRGAGHVARPFSFEGWGSTFHCEFAVDSFNVLNRTNPRSYVGVESSPLFGQPNAAYNGREMQFTLQVRF